MLDLNYFHLCSTRLKIALTNAFKSVKGCEIQMEYVLNVLEKSINSVRIEHLNLASILIVAE